MIKKIFSLFDRKQKINLYLLGIITIIGSGVELLGVSLISPLVKIVTEGGLPAEYERYVGWLNYSTPQEYVVFFAVLLAVVYILKNLYVSFEYNLQYHFSYDNFSRLSTELMGYYLHQEYLFHASKNVAELSRNIMTDVDTFWNVVQNMVMLVNELLVCLVLVSYLMITDPISTGVIAGLMVVFVAFFFLVYRRYSSRLGAESREYAGSQNKWILQSFAGIKEIKVSNTENFFHRQYGAVTGKVCTNQRKQAFIAIIPRPVMETICICGLLLVMAARIATGTQMATFVPVLSVFVVAAFRMLPSFNRISGYLSCIMYGRASVENVYRDVTAMKAYGDAQKEDIEDDYQFAMATDITIKGLSFRYPGAEKQVLSEAELVIPRLKTLALVGPSGSGKTTLADLILGVLEPDAGEIISDGTNIFEHIHSWHRQIGYIPQTIYLMDDTIRNNVAFGLSGEEIDENRVVEALREAQLYDFIQKLPDGLDTMVGDRGVRLSGGQRQRIGIARALYTRPKLLILDEATSALDNETETAVMESIDSLHGSRTMIIIAHRLSTIQNADEIYEVGNGQIVRKNREDVLK